MGLSRQAKDLTHIDIHTKCRILTEQMARHPECTSVHEIVEKELKQNLHILNGNNNEKHGYPKGHPLHNYESGTSILAVLMGQQAERS